MKTCHRCKMEKTLEHFASYNLKVFNYICKSCATDKAREWKRSKKGARIEHDLWTMAKFRAKKKDIEFNLEKEDITIPSICPVLGIPLILAKGKPNSNSPTLDRIDNRKGYTKDNIVVISFRANAIKRDSSLEELKLIVRYYESIG